MKNPFFTAPSDAKKSSFLVHDEGKTAIEAEADLPPVVARMVVEIRSDGTRTMARGALEDLQTGEKVALQANALNPVALAQELTKTLLKTPILAGTLAKQAVLGMLPEALRDEKTGKFRLRADKLRFSRKDKSQK
jgi:hypothetical protein